MAGEGLCKALPQKRHPQTHEVAVYTLNHVLSPSKGTLYQNIYGFLLEGSVCTETMWTLLRDNAGMLRLLRLKKLCSS